MSTLKDDAVKVGAMVVLAALGLWWLKSKGVFTALDPTDPNNIVNRTVEGLYQSVTGSTGTIGTDIYDATHGGALDVTSQNNVIYTGVNGIGSAVSGDENFTLGGWIYDITH